MSKNAASVVNTGKDVTLTSQDAIGSTSTDVSLVLFCGTKDDNEEYLLYVVIEPPLTNKILF